ncbi:MAG TPA: SDR family NAD(P)-dependent oxidoreductase [Devosia sp.]|nr:SDR family NAD(P)-dependent oxidoreductase [Devosia sp.]
MADQQISFAVITGASSGIGFELARCCAEAGADIVIASDTAEIFEAADRLKPTGVKVEAVQADLSTISGVDELYARVRQFGRQPDALIANAGRGLGQGFLDEDFSDIRRVIDTNITGTIYFLHKFGRDLVQRGDGRILITGSIAGVIPGAFQAVYNGSKAFLDSFAYALRNEIKESGVTVTVLMPGPTDTDFFETAGLTDTKLGTEKKADPAKVAKEGFEAMLRGDGHEVTGFANKMQVMMARFAPDSMLAEQHRKIAEPGSARH